jgi:hypothetical protein
MDNVQGDHQASYKLPPLFNFPARRAKYAGGPNRLNELIIY